MNRPDRGSRREARLDALRDWLSTDGVLHLRDIANRLGVSAMTVRRDLSAAPSEFHFLGGYVMLPGGGPSSSYQFEVEGDVHADAKARACAHAAALIEPDDTIFVDCGTTMPHLVAALPKDSTLTVVCFALNIATLLSERPQIRLILLGGEYAASSASFFGEEGLRILDRIGINKAFISAGGLHASHGVSCSNFHEVPIKQAAMRRSLKRYLVLDESKIGKVKPAPFARLDEFDAAFTEAGVLQLPLPDGG